MDVFEAIEARRSVRRYKATPIPEDVVKKVFRAVRRAPSANNAQPYRFIVVRDEDKKHALINACKGKRWIAEAPMIIIACGIIDEAYSTMGGYMSSYPVDVSIALDHLTLAAAAEGLGTCWIGAFSEEKVKELYDIGSEAKVVALMTIGYPAEEPEATPRKGVSEIFLYGEYR